ncbi:MAG: hypothetical protein PF638_14605 [Candidatus Delongbacteria bacterium]|jgi:hypothetical protein|nr:hypothetical protein [Candidatus Delongbacteria bacterium]
MTKYEMDRLKTNIKSFFKEFKNYNIKELSDEKIQEFINTHYLDIENLKSIYATEFKRSDKKS